MKEIELTPDILALKLEPGDYLVIVNRNNVDIESLRYLRAPKKVTGNYLLVDGDPRESIMVIQNDPK